MREQALLVSRCKLCRYMELADGNSKVLVVSTYSFSQLPLKSPFSLLGMLAQTCVNCESVETLKTSIRFLSQQTASGS